MLQGRGKVPLEWEVVGEEMFRRRGVFPVVVENHYSKKKGL
jgi:hypothetical protein